MTHFVAGLGTCGTITGTGRFLKQQNKGIGVIGVHPAEGHDIPGVRSIRQLKQTALFFPNEYDALVEIHNEEAFALTQRLNQEEAIIAGPSSGMALAGALRQIPDEPGVIAVVMFPDNAFKYSTSFKKHLPELFKSSKPDGAGLNPNLAKIVEFARNSADVIDAGAAVEVLKNAPGAVLVDVRSKEEYESGHAPNAINIPLADIADGYPAGLPDDRSIPVVAMCKVGERSLLGMLLLKSLGYHAVTSVRGGIQAWREAGLPVEVTS